MGGALVVRDDSLAETLRFHQNAMGAVPGPFDCFLTHRGLKTLALRMERHCDNAEAVVAHLADHPAVSEVIYPGLPAPPGSRAGRRARCGATAGSCRSGSRPVSRPRWQVCDATRLWTLGESLGGVESLIEHPGRMTHASVAGTELEVPGGPDPALGRRRDRRRPGRRPRPGAGGAG